MNISLLIDELGGPTSVSEGLRTNTKDPTPAAVTMWCQRDEIPHKWRYPLFHFARSKNVAVKAEDIGLPFEPPGIGPAPVGTAA